MDDHEDESAASVNDLDIESTADVSASASAADYNLPPHEDEILDLSSEDVRKTVVLYVLDQSPLQTMLPTYHNGLSKYDCYSLEIILNACTPKVPIEAIDSHRAVVSRSQ